MGSAVWGFLCVCVCVCVQATLKPGRPATEVALQAGLSPRRKGGLELET